MTPPRILITRAAADCLPLAAALEAQGLSAAAVPLLRYEFPEPLPPVPQAGWLILTSPRAAGRLPRDARPPGLRVAAVGSATRAVACERGWTPDATGTGSGLDLGRSLGGSGGPFTWWCGDRALPGLQAGLAGHGAAAVQVAVYRTVLLDPGPRAWSAVEDAIDGAIFASPSAAVAFEASAPAPLILKAKRALPAVAAGPSTLRELMARGFLRIFQAEHPSPEGLALAAARAL